MQPRYTVTLVITVRSDGMLRCWCSRNTPTGRESRPRDSARNLRATEYYPHIRTWDDVLHGPRWRDCCRIVVRAHKRTL